jgi:hypothetical protein
MRLAVLTRWRLDGKLFGYDKVIHDSFDGGRIHCLQAAEAELQPGVEILRLRVALEGNLFGLQGDHLQGD